MHQGISLMCHCEGALRPWQSREGTHVDRTRHCRGAACPSRRCTGVINRLSAKRRTPKVCHCEEAAGRRGNLGKALTLIAHAIVGERHAAPGAMLPIRTG